MAGNWEAVAAALSAPVAAPSVKASSRTTFGALVSGGFDPDKIIAAFRASPSGAALIAKLNADPDGIDWSDELTQFVVDRIVAAGGDVTAAVAALLVGLSTRTTTLAGGVVTAEQCQADWAAGVAADGERQTQARIAAQRASIRSLDAESIVPEVPLTLDAAVDAIRAALTAFGGFA